MTLTITQKKAGPGNFLAASFVLFTAPLTKPLTKMAQDRPLMIAMTALLTLLPLSGIDLTGPLATIIACAAILLIGMPHGAFDYHLITGQAKGSLPRGAALVSAYLLLAAFVYAVWQIYPVAALLMFLVISAVHFSEDWPVTVGLSNEAGRSPDLLSVAPAAAIICLPAIVYPQELAAAFAQLTGNASTQIAADIMLLIAPVAVLLALVKAATYWNDDDYEGGVTLLLSLLAMAVLPPVIGFALYFCLVHSPRQFAHSKAELQQKAQQLERGPAQRAPSALWMVWPISALAMFIAAAIFYTEIRADLASAALASVFMTLSMLTVPHMAMPMLVKTLNIKRRP